MDPSNPITQVYQDEDGTPHNIGFPKNGAGDREPVKKTKKKRRRKTCCSFQWRSLLCCVPSRCSKKNNCCNETVEAPVQKSAEESDGYSANVQDSTSAARFLLPPLKANDEKKCLIIDLDETLVHSSFKPISNADFVVPVEIDGVVHQVYVLKRPHVDEFLQSVGKIYECVLFTASLAKYADPVADLLDKWDVFSSRLFREACVFHRGNYVKDLGRLGRDLDRVVIIDNSPASYIFHPENAVPVASWFDDMSDTELLDLIPYLENLSQAKDIYAYLRTNPHPLSCKRSSDREPAGGGSSDASSSSSACSPVPGTSQSAGIITSVEKPGTSRRHPLVVSAGSVASPASEPSGSSASAMNTAGDGDNCIQQLSNAVGRLALHESSNALTRATPMADMNRYDSTSFTKTGDGLPASASGNDYSFNVMVSNGNGSPSGASGDAHLFNTSAGSVKTP